MPTMHTSTRPCAFCSSTQLTGFMQQQIQGGALGAQAPPQPRQHTSIDKCLAEQPASAPSLQPRNLDLIYNWLQNLAKNLFIGWKCRVPLTSLAVYLVRGNIVDVVSLKWAWSKVFACASLIYFSTPLSRGPGSALIVCRWRSSKWNNDADTRHRQNYVLYRALVGALWKYVT